MTKLHAQLLASKWVLLLERHQMELDEMRREIEEMFGKPCPLCHELGGLHKPACKETWAS